jgi:hypothetical protein
LQSFAIETKNLTKRFRVFTSLSDLNLSLFVDVIIRSEREIMAGRLEHRSNLPNRD